MNKKRIHLQLFLLLVQVKQEAKILQTKILINLQWTSYFQFSILFQVYKAKIQHRTIHSFKIRVLLTSMVLFCLSLVTKVWCEKRKSLKYSRRSKSRMTEMVMRKKEIKKITLAKTSTMPNRTEWNRKSLQMAPCYKVFWKMQRTTPIKSVNQ